MRMKGSLFLVLAVSLSIIIGCEWDGSNDDDSMGSSTTWVDFSGVYRPGEGEHYVVSSFTSPVISANADGLVEATERLGTGTGNTSNRVYTSTLSNTPVDAGSISITVDDVVWLLDKTNGTLTASAHGGTSAGTIDYDSGYITVTFGSTTVPATGAVIEVSYLYASATYTPGSTMAIYSLTVFQEDMKLSFTDSNGGEYSGILSSVNTPGGDLRDTTNQILIIEGFEVMGSFQVSGTAANGTWVEIVGTLQSEYTVDAAGTDSDVNTKDGVTMSGYLINRTIQGTWMESNGTTGDLKGFANSMALGEVGSTSTDVPDNDIPPTDTNTTHTDPDTAAN